MRPDPGDERERAQTRPDIVREPENDKREEREVAEEAISRHGPAICGRVILFRLVQSSKEDC